MLRIGTGYDLHRLAEGRPLILGGVTIPHDTGFDAHSDGDVLAHAVIDALLGAAAAGNIGLLFPDTDPAYAGADSLELLYLAFAEVNKNGFSVVNIDATIIAETPKLNPYLGEMCANLADRLGVEVAQVSVKAKTNEGVGPEGLGEAISAQAVVLLEID